jgi:hypothetical protein
MSESFTSCEDIDTLLDHVWVAPVPREVRRFVEEWMPGKKLTERVEESIIDFLQGAIGEEDHLSARLDESYNIAERLKEHLSGLEEDAREAREELEAERQRAADMDTETRGGSAPPLHRSGRVVADDALNKDKNMTENKTPSPDQILKLAEYGLTITSKKNAATAEVPWMHGRVINRLVGEGFLEVLAEAAHEKEIKTTEKGLMEIEEDEEVTPPAPAKANDEDEDEDEDLEFADEDGVDDVDNVDNVAEERCVVYVTLNRDGQVSVDLDAQAILAYLALALKS